MTPLGKFLPIVGQPDPAQPKNVHLVGRYAIGVTWADDHGSIYPFDRLRLDDQTEKTTAEGALTQEMTWPKEITKLPDALRVGWLDGHVVEAEAVGRLQWIALGLRRRRCWPEKRRAGGEACRPRLQPFRHPFPSRAVSGPEGHRRSPAGAGRRAP